MKALSIVVISLLAFALLMAKPPINSNAEIAISDSLSIQKEKDIAAEYGFRDNDRLSEVAEKLEIQEIKLWKNYLGLEAENTQINSKTLRQLGISPYQALLAQQSVVYGLNEMNTISEAATLFNMPIKKLKEMLGLNPLDRSIDNSSLQAMERTPEEVIEQKKDFWESRVQYAGSITIVGMLVVFSSLALSSFMISQLVHLNRKPKAKPSVIKLGKDGKITAPDSLNKNIITAAIAALHIHIQSIEDRRRILLTFKRAPINMWRATKIQTMPNREFDRRRS